MYDHRGSWRTVVVPDRPRPAVGDRGDPYKMLSSGNDWSGFGLGCRFHAEPFQWITRVDIPNEPAVHPTAQTFVLDAVATERRTERSPGVGTSWRFHELPFQRRTTAVSPEVLLNCPDAHARPVARASTPHRTAPVPGDGDGVRRHREPFQCRISVPVSMSPTAHASD